MWTHAGVLPCVRGIHGNGVNSSSSREVQDKDAACLSLIHPSVHPSSLRPYHHVTHPLAVLGRSMKVGLVSSAGSRSSVLCPVGQDTNALRLELFSGAFWLFVLCVTLCRLSWGLSSHMLGQRSGWGEKVGGTLLSLCPEEDGLSLRTTGRSERTAEDKSSHGTKMWATSTGDMPEEQQECWLVPTQGGASHWTRLLPLDEAPPTGRGPALRPPLSSPSWMLVVPANSIIWRL